MWSVTLGALALGIAFTILNFRLAAPLWQRLGFVAFTGLAVVAVVELAMTRVELTATGIAYVKSFRRIFIPRTDVESVTWAKGGGVFLKLADGRSVNLPDVGRSPQGLANSIRAWLKRTPPGSRES